MTAEFPSFHLLLHASSILLYQCVMSLSTAMCLTQLPSPFTIVALNKMMRVSKQLDRFWLCVTVAIITWSFHISDSSRNFVGVVLVLVVFGATVLGHVIFHRTLGKSLNAASLSVHSAGPVVQIIKGEFVGVRRSEEEAVVDETSDGLYMSSCGMVILYVTLTISVVVFQFYWCFRQISSSLFPFSTGTQCLLILTTWIMICILINDLSMDTWPGFSSPKKLKRAMMYYVQLFEQFIVWPIPISLMIVCMISPIAWWWGLVPWYHLGFVAVLFGWMCSVLVQRCLVGRDSRRLLPFPMFVNKYMAIPPFWAHFATVAHFLMVAFLLATAFYWIGGFEKGTTLDGRKNGW